MLSSWKPSTSTVCLDASFVVRMLVDSKEGPVADRLWVKWQKEGRRLVAPPLMFFEISNAVYRYVRADLFSLERALQVLETALRLDIDLVTYPELHQEALRLAHEWRLPATYDAHYLALARRLQAPFWTADRRLARLVRPHFPHVHLLGEEGAS